MTRTDLQKPKSWCYLCSKEHRDEPCPLTPDERAEAIRRRTEREPGSPAPIRRKR